MSRYIDENKFLSNLGTDRWGITNTNEIGIALDKAVVDVVEVRHGRWLVCGTFDDFLTCSVCKSNKYPFGYDFKYCPECGAKMDGERREG